MSALIGAVKLATSSIPVRVTTEKPGMVKVTEYTPGRRSTMRYWPALSVIAVLTPSISTGLLASTVTPGSTPPEASLTTPARALCADTLVASRTDHMPTNTTTEVFDRHRASPWLTSQAFGECPAGGRRLPHSISEIKL